MGRRALVDPLALQPWSLTMNAKSKAADAKFCKYCGSALQDKLSAIIEIRVRRGLETRLPAPNAFRS